MKRGVVIYLAGRFIPAIVNLAVIVLAIRFLGPVEYGRYSLILYTALLVITLSFHWVQASILRFLGGMPTESGVVMSRLFDLTILSAFISTGLVVTAGHFYLHLGWLELLLAALFAMLSNFFLFHQAVLEAYHKSIRTAILEGTDQLLIMIVLLAGLFFFEMRSSTILLASLVIGLAGALLLRTLIRVKGLLAIDLKHIYWDSRFSGKVIEFGYSVTLWLFFSQVLMAADRFILMEYCGYRDAGMYSALKDLLFKGTTFAIFPIYISYQSKISDNWNTHHPDMAWKNVKEALSFEILIFIIVFIVFMVAKPYIFSNMLLIPEMDSWLVYLPLLLSAFLWQGALLLQRFLDLMLRQLYVVIILTSCVVLNVLANIILVPKFGYLASSVGMLVTSVLYSGLVVFFAVRTWNRRPE
jgi:O-antigen/teichoic acid export membrane protein